MAWHVLFLNMFIVYYSCHWRGDSIPG